MWLPGYVHSVLTNRAVIGEFQAYTWRGKEKRPVGEPVPDYYPRIVDDDTFYRAQTASRQRQFNGGRRGKVFSNLLIGLCRGTAII